jgi:hypothetical protein
MSIPSALPTPLANTTATTVAAITQRSAVERIPESM